MGTLSSSESLLTGGQRDLTLGLGDNYKVATGDLRLESVVRCSFLGRVRICAGYCYNFC